MKFMFKLACRCQWNISCSARERWLNLMQKAILGSLKFATFGRWKIQRRWLHRKITESSSHKMDHRVHPPPETIQPPTQLVQKKFSYKISPRGISLCKEKEKKCKIPSRHYFFHFPELMNMNEEISLEGKISFMLVSLHVIWAAIVVKRQVFFMRLVIYRRRSCYPMF